MITIDPSNADQRDAWDGDTGAFWADNADRFDRGVAAYRGPVGEADDVGEGASVLDIGCGTGQATRDAARRAAGGPVLGVDLSARMIDLARRRAADEGLSTVTFREADAQVHPFDPASVDVALSRHGSMFFGDPVAAFTNVARALRPGGRLVLLTWQDFGANEFMSGVRAALAAGRVLPEPPTDGPGPFALSDPDRVRALLGAAGFVDVELAGLREPMDLGADPDDALGYLAGQHAGLLRGLDPDTRADALDTLRADLVRHQTARGVLYGSAAWLVRARRP